MKSLTKSFLSTIFPKTAPSTAAAKPRTVRNDAPQWKELGQLTSRNVRGLFDSIENCVYFDTGEVVQFRGRFNKRVTNRTEAQAELQKWAQYKGLIKQGEFIAVR
ncbi:hypothetical protein [Vibrio parahaemolyticus]|uniref:hypothetical protein n=1 Tax=Vibrio parahaemolyticus TaxID=670 RepID=UPI002F7A36B3